MPKCLPKAHTQKEIVSAMVRLNQYGIQVPVNMADFKNLPVIPNTGARTAKNKTVLEEDTDNY